MIEIDDDMNVGGDADISFDFAFAIGFCVNEISSGGEVFFGVPSSVFIAFCFGLFMSVCEDFLFSNEPPGCGVIVNDSCGLLFAFVAGMIEISEFEKLALLTGDFDGILS